MGTRLDSEDDDDEAPAGKDEGSSLAGHKSREDHICSQADGITE
jgi:hypothetical protein